MSALFTPATLNSIRMAARQGAPLNVVASNLGWTVDRLQRCARVHGIVFVSTSLPPANADTARGEAPPPDAIPVRIMLGCNERARLRALADADGVPMNEWVRGLVIAAIARRETEAAE